MATRYVIEVKGNWGGASGSWRPAVTGTLNQTGRSDEEASTFDTHEAAKAILDNVILPEAGPSDDSVTPGGNSPQFAIREVAAS